jgi:hypothetical protein
MSGIKTQGKLHEEAAIKTIGGDAYNLNGAAANAMVGNQFPTYDICSSTELASVKSHISQPGACKPADIEAYKADFSHMLGWNRSEERGLSPLQQDADRISGLSTKGFEVPAELKGAGQDQTVDYLKNNSILRIPDDHVAPVKAALDKAIQSLPGNYFLPENPSDQQVQAVLNRVKGTGLSSSETAQLMDTQDQADQQVESQLKDVALEGAAQAVPEVALAEQVVNSEEVQQVETAAADQAGVKAVSGDTSQPNQALSQEDNPAYDASQSQEESGSESDGYQYGYGY